MDFDKYQKESRKTAIYPNMDNNFIYPILGLVGESGEVAEKVKKVIRDENSSITDKKREELKKELGDVLWYLANFATELNLSLNDIAKLNIKKLTSRNKRGVLHGDGDNR